MVRTIQSGSIIVHAFQKFRECRNDVCVSKAPPTRTHRTPNHCLVPAIYLSLNEGMVISIFRAVLQFATNEASY